MCFPAGTLINAEHGQIPIEQIKTGGRVWAFDESTGIIALKEVLQTTQRECDHTIELYTERETIETTAEHPFYTTDGWKDAADLQAGDRIATRDNETVEITEIKFSCLPKLAYNFEVAGWHTYFVSAVFNPAQMPPYTLPANAHTMGFKSNTTKGGGRQSGRVDSHSRAKGYGYHRAE